MKERGYQGIKFIAHALSRQTPDDERLDKLKYWGRYFHYSGFAPPYEGGSYGNLSFRIKPGENKFIITCSRTGLAETDSYASFATVAYIDFQDGRVYYHGVKEPSSESMVHSAIYLKRPEVSAIFHGHWRAPVLKKATKLKLPTAEFADYGTSELVHNVLEVLENNYFLILAKHGFLSFAPTIEEAGSLSVIRYNSIIYSNGRC